MERAAFADLAFHLFELTRTGDFAIQNFRFVAAGTQMIPLVAIGLGWSLKTVALLYSLSFALLPLVVIGILLLWVKDLRFAVLLFLFHALMLSHTFFWTQSELPQGISVFVLYLAILLKPNAADFRKRGLRSALLILLSITAVFAHPLMFFAVVFAHAYLFLHEPGRRKEITQYSVFIFLVYVVKTLFFRTPYDSQAGGQLLRNWKTPDVYFHSGAFDVFLNQVFTLYAVWTLVLLTSIGFLIRQHALQKLAMLVLAVLGMVVLINLTYPGGAELFYLENQFQLLAFFVAFPLVFDVLPRLKMRVSATAVGLILCMAVVRIVLVGQEYHDRLSWMEETSQYFSGQKTILTEADVDPSLMKITWASSYEFWLVSTIRQQRSACVIIETRPDEFNWLLGEEDTFIAKWGSFSQADLPANYFPFNLDGRYQKNKRY